MQLCGLLHDVGKVMYSFGCDEDGTSQQEQWGLVGDTWVVGCKLPESCIFSEFNSLNMDNCHPEMQTDLGVYEAHCGLDNLHLAWGHDEYLWHVLNNHEGNTIPLEGMAMIRYHSFYPWHSCGEYTQFETKIDEKYKAAVLDFNKYDLYTKCEQTINIDEMKEYYMSIAEKYLDSIILHW